MNREAVVTAFYNYTSNYNPENPKIKLKIDHTYRVADLAVTIAKDIRADADLAWLCGMLHDIGRFEQVTRYNTFSDALSVDHALLGAEILFQEGLIKEMCPNLGEYEISILEKAIRNHSAYRIEAGLNNIETTYCNILRDADKIDIFRVNCDTPLEEIYNISTAELRASSVSEEVKECFRNETAVLRELKKLPADFVVGHLCLIFELVYPISLTIAREQGYVDKLLSFESNNPETRDWFEYMKTKYRSYANNDSVKIADINM